MCAFMWGELTNRETMKRLEETLENQEQEQFEVLLYRKNSESELLWIIFCDNSNVYNAMAAEPWGLGGKCPPFDF